MMNIHPITTVSQETRIWYIDI